MLIAVLLWGIQLIIWKIRNKRYKVNKNKIRLKNIGQNKRFMIVS